jgi:hypothetical protein
VFASIKLINKTIGYQQNVLLTASFLLVFTIGKFTWFSRPPVFVKASVDAQLLVSALRLYAYRELAQGADRIDAPYRLW